MLLPLLRALCSAYLWLPDWGMLCDTANPEQGWSQGLSGASKKTCLGKVAVTLESLLACLGLAGTSIQQGGVGGGEWQGQLKER